ncbi:MAG: glycosyltransferase family 2 protein [Thermoleophilaceae bacterium]
MAPTLSICVPTHEGRARVLDRALASVAEQLDGLGGQVQVCVSDNGTRDATPEVVAAYATRLGDALVVHRFETDQGATRNFLKVVEIARGNFCWLLGSDDTVEPGGVAEVLAVLDAQPDLTGITTNRLHVDDLNPAAPGLDDPRILPPPERTRYDSAEEILGELAMLQDYISTQVLSRERWLEAVDNLGLERLLAARHFPQLLILTEMIRRAPRWYWLAEPVIGHRVGVAALADSFGDATMSHYTITVTENRARIWAELFGTRSPIYRAAMWRSWFVQANPVILAYYKLQPGHGFAEDVRLLTTLTRFYWFLPQFWLTSFPVLLVPQKLIPRSLARVGSALGRRLRARRPPASRAGEASP